MALFVNNEPVKRFNFSGGECHIQLPILHFNSSVAMYADLYCSDDIMALLLTIDAIRRCNANIEIDLTIPYFPYARQDRVCNSGEALSVKVMANLINSLKCRSVTIYDPHSDVTPALITNCIVKSIEDIIYDSPLCNAIIQHNMSIVSPDAGAEKKVRKVTQKISERAHGIDIICAGKVRDVKTGAIISSQIYGNVKDKKLIIIDDICDGGSTFIELARLLKQQGASELYLYVTHGIFSKGLEPLKEYFKHVYCYHAFNHADKNEMNFLTILESNNNEY